MLAFRTGSACERLCCIDIYLAHCCEMKNTRACEIYDLTKNMHDKNQVELTFSLLSAC